MIHDYHQLVYHPVVLKLLKKKSTGFVVISSHPRWQSNTTSDRGSLNDSEAGRGRESSDSE